MTRLTAAEQVRRVRAVIAGWEKEHTALVMESLRGNLSAGLAEKDLRLRIDTLAAALKADPVPRSER